MAESIFRIGNKLGAYKTRPNKDVILKLLKQAADALPELKQSDTLRRFMKPLSDSLIKHSLLQHGDKEIRLYVGFCFVEIIRVLAPNPGFEDEVLRDTFELLISIFGDLTKLEDVFFSKRIELLQTVAKLQFYLLMLDTGCDDLVIKMFKTFFNVVREKHPPSSIVAMTSIITRILEEKVQENQSGDLILEGNVFEPLLDVILRNLKEAEGTSASTKLAVSVIQSCGEKLENMISLFLRSCILNKESVKTDLKELHHEIILQIFRCAPQMLLSVIPSLTHELLTDQVDVRIKALNLIRKLFAMPGHCIGQNYRHVFIEFLNRFSDKSVEVRLNALSCAKTFYITNPLGTEALEVLAAIEARLLDIDDRVRTEAVSVVCDLLIAKPKTMHFELISKVAERMRDKKAIVRRKALRKLLELYQQYCIHCAGDVMDSSDQFEQIPSKILMLCNDKSLNEFRPPSMISVLEDDLFPPSLSLEERTKHWIFMSSLFTPSHLKALKLILSHKRRLQNEMKAYLRLRNTAEENHYKEMQSEIKSSFLKLSAFFPDPAKAEDYFHRLNATKDTCIFHAFAELVNEGSLTYAQIAKDNFLKTIGQSNPLFKFMQSVSMKCMFIIFSSEQVSLMIDHLTGHISGEKNTKDSCAQLLLAVISIFPSLLRGSEEKFQSLLENGSIPFNDELLQILAKEGSTFPIKLCNIYPFLERLCLEGTRAQAKLAVSAIAKLAATRMQLMFSKLFKVLFHSLQKDQNTAAGLQSLGCAAQHSVSTFESQADGVFVILEDILKATNDDMSTDLDFLDKNLDCSHSCKLKIYALKALVRSFLPHKRADVTRPITPLLDIVLQMLQKGEYSDGSVTCDSDKNFIKLAAAKSVLRLSRRWDLHISPQLFTFAILVAKDHSSLLSGPLLSKIDKLLSRRMLPSRYACAFFVTAVDCSGDLQDTLWKYTERFIKEYGKASPSIQSSTVAVTDYPLYVVVYLVFVLAHDTSFPNMDSQVEEHVAEFFRPLVFSLEALVNPNFVDNNLDLINKTVSFLRSIFHAIKLAEDCVDKEMTPRLHILADFGLSILKAMTGTSVPVNLTPGQIFLPSSMFKASASSSIHQGMDVNFSKKLIHKFRTQISQTTSALFKHILQKDDEALPTDTAYCKLPLVSHKKVDLSANVEDACNLEKQLHGNMDENAIHGCKPRAEPFTICDELTNSKERKLDSCGNSDSPPAIQRSVDWIHELDSCGNSNSLTNDSLPVMPKEFSFSRLKEDAISKCNSINTQVSEAENINLKSGTHKKGRSLIGHRINLWSPIEKCYHAGTVDEFHPKARTYKITYESGEADVISLDGKQWEISVKSTGEKGPRVLQPLNCNNLERSSESCQTKADEHHSYGCKQQKLSKSEENFPSKLSGLNAANIKKRNKGVTDTSASEIINTSTGAFGRKSRRKT
ncbi:chromatin/chromatin-binding, or -regulatory protein [Lithospermum erythrorhizon]|uniref:Chromatin/chromatin-binding, or -regulatory protein n=1 Tax=Lithospermum erythrorhizon TaxID=34254 RepID=A0AAV3NWD6_LITER